jgi:hypothetical protein
MFKKLAILYQTNKKFHAFVAGVEGAAVAALVSYGGGIPTTKAAWITLGAFVGKAVYGAIKQYLIENA